MRVCMCGMDTDPVQHVGPALHGDALEDSQHGEQEVVKVGDAAIWSMPALSALGVVEGAGTTMPVHGTWGWLILCYYYTHT